MNAASENLMWQLRAEHAAMLRVIVEANRDLATRAQLLGVRAEYDAEEDSISVMIGPVVESSAESVENRIYFSVEPDTLKIVGVDVYGVRDLLTSPPEELEGMAKAVASLAAAILVQADIAEGRIVDSLAQGIRELAPI